MVRVGDDVALEEGDDAALLEVLDHEGDGFGWEGVGGCVEESINLGVGFGFAFRHLFERRELFRVHRLIRDLGCWGISVACDADAEP